MKPQARGHEEVLGGDSAELCPPELHVYSVLTSLWCVCLLTAQSARSLDACCVGLLPLERATYQVLQALGGWLVGVRFMWSSEAPASKQGVHPPVRSGTMQGVCGWDAAQRLG